MTVPGVCALSVKGQFRHDASVVRAVNSESGKGQDADAPGDQHMVKCHKRRHLGVGRPRGRQALTRSLGGVGEASGQEVAELAVVLAGVEIAQQER